MKNPKLFLIGITLLIGASNTQASNFFIAIEHATGTDKFINTGQYQNLKAGDSVSPVFGYNFTLPRQAYYIEEMLRLSISLGGDIQTYSNAEETLNVTPIELLYLYQYDGFMFGGGLALHLSPEYNIDVKNIGNVNFNYDDAIGVVGQIAYVVKHKHEAGIRYTAIDYKGGNSFVQNNVSANSLGFYYAYNFR